MLYIEKGPEPEALTQAKRNGLRDYDEMTSDVKTEIKKQLAQEQGYLCAYCMRRLTLDTMQIEHFIPRHPIDGSYDPALTIDYHNMLGVCPGNKGEGFPLSYLTCDQHRRNTPLHVNPLNRRSISLITYKANGIIDSPDLVIRDDLTNILNLNCAVVHLPENRRAALIRLQRQIYSDYGNRPAPKAYFEHLYASLLQKDRGILREYLGIMLNYLEKKIAKIAR